MYLGIDLGTSGVKALVIDDTQRPVASRTMPLSVSRPHDGWSEQDPADWITATAAALDALRTELGDDMGRIRGIGLSGQMHGATLLGADDSVLRPCILWNDTRSHAEAARLDADPKFRAVTGNITFPGFTAPKLAWVQNQEPRIFDSVAKVLLPKDYLRLWLTGEHVSEMSDASGTSWLDVSARDWSDPLLKATGLRRDQMPRLVEGNAPSGGLRAELAQQWGMRTGTVVAGGAGDNAASAIGLGITAAGDGFVSLGTSGVLLAATDAYRPNPASAVHTFCHALPDTWHQMGVILSAASALDWLAGVMGASPSALVDELGTDVQAPGPVTFLPYLSGERTPHNDPHLRGSFDGLSHATTRADMTRAVLQGVAFALRENQQALAEAGTTIGHLVAVGGGSRADHWLRLIATVLNHTVAVPAQGDYGAAFGAARLGMMATGAASRDETCTPVEIRQVLEPVAGLAQAFDTAFDRFVSLRR